MGVGDGELHLLNETNKFFSFLFFFSFFSVFVVVAAWRGLRLSFRVST